MYRSIIASIRRLEMHHIQRSTRNLLAAGLAIACSTQMAFTQPSRNVGRAANVVQHSVLRGVDSEITFDTLPNAACAVNPQGAPAGHTMKLYSDDDGKVHFYAKPPADADVSGTPQATAQLTLTCEANGQAIAHSVSLTPVADPKDATTSSGATAQAPGSGRNRKIRPALAGDPMRLSNEELFAQGYPMRPDPEQAPDAYATWLQAVSKPATFVPPNFVRGDKSHGSGTSSLNLPCLVCGLPLPSLPPTTLQGTSNVWSGFVVSDVDAGYDMVLGTWVVPQVFAPETNTTDRSSIWVGLDGWQSTPGLISDVLQAGTEQEVETVAVGSLDLWTYTSYYVWTEWYNTYDGEVEKVLSGFHVHHGDQFYVYVFIGDNGVANPYGETGYFVLENLTTGEYSSTSEPKKSYVNFFDNSVEWIVERPTFNTVSHLANYVTASITGAYAYKGGASPAFVPYGSVNNVQVTMKATDTNDVLSIVFPLSKTSMLFNWLGRK